MTNSRPFRYSTISEPPSFEPPFTRSTNVIGACKQPQDLDQLQGERLMNLITNNYSPYQQFFLKNCNSSIFLFLKAIKKYINLKSKTKYTSPKKINNSKAKKN